MSDGFIDQILTRKSNRSQPLRVRLDEGHLSLRSEGRVGSLRMVEEMDFLETVKRKYVGRWIGLKGSDVLVVSDSHDEILRQLREKGADGVYVFYSPTENEKQYGFLFVVYK
jgi:hypothetical protein